MPRDSTPPFDPFGGESTGFDYAAFSELLDADLETEVTEVTDAPTAQDVNDDRLFLALPTSKSEATVSIVAVEGGTAVSIVGKLNESFDGPKIGAQLTGSVVFDLQGISRVTSFGIRAWLAMFEAASFTEAVIYRASPAVIDQVSMMRNFVGTAKVHSFVAPYRCSNGHDFGVLYKALDDEHALTTRTPIEVSCPEGGGETEFMEDPMSFFDFDEQRVVELTPNLTQLIHHLETADAARELASIELAKVDDITRIRVAGALSSLPQLPETFSGLDGTILVDLRQLTTPTSEEAASFVRQIRSLNADTFRILLAACPILIAEQERRDPIDGVRYLSVTSSVLKTDGTSKPVLVDITRHGSQLAQGKPPETPEFANGTLAGLDVMQRLVRQSPTKGPRVPNLADPEASGLAVVPVDKVSRPIVFVGGALLFAFIIAISLYSVFGSADPKVTHIDRQKAGQKLTNFADEDGATTLPEWATQTLAVDGDHLVLTGRAYGLDVESAGQAAKKAALARLVPVLVRASKNLHADDHLPEQPNAELQTRLLKTLQTLTLTETNNTTRAVAGQHEGAVQFKVTRAAVEQSLATRSTTYRGLRLTERPFWTEAGLRVVERASYLGAIEPGDMLATVGDAPVSDVPSFTTAVSPLNGDVVLTLTRDGNPYRQTMKAL